MIIFILYMDSGIYIIKNLVNNKIYIGSSIEIKKREISIFPRGSFRSINLASSFLLLNNFQKKHEHLLTL